MDCHEICATGKGALNHKLGKREDDRWENMASPKHSLADRHEICHGVVAITDELQDSVLLMSTYAEGYLLEIVSN